MFFPPASHVKEGTFQLFSVHLQRNYLTFKNNNSAPFRLTTVNPNEKKQVPVLNLETFGNLVILHILNHD